MNSSGSNIARYPIKLPAKASNGASVIDTEGRSNFSIFIACENGQIYAYELNGKPVSDWHTDRNLSGVRTSVELVQFHKKRKLLIQSQDELYISDRRGRMDRLNSNVSTRISSNLRVLSDSSGSSIICSRDSNGTITLYFDEQNIKTIYTPAQSINNCISQGQSKSDLIEGILYKDSIIFRNLDDKITCVKYQSKLETYNWIHSTDNNSTSWSGLSSGLTNRFFLIDTDCNTTKGFPVNGSGEFSIRSSEKSNNLILSIGSENSTIYLYHIE